MEVARGDEKIVKELDYRKNPRKRTPSLRMKKTVEYFTEQNGHNLGLAMRRAGYTVWSAKNPGWLTDSKTFMMLCQSRGLNPEMLLEALVHDINNKPERRVGELNLGAEILGMKKIVNVNNIQVNIMDGMKSLNNEYSNEV